MSGLSASQTNAAYIQIAINLDLIPPEQLLEGTSLTPQKLARIKTVNTDVAVQIVRNLERYCQRPDWRTLFGGHIGMTSHGPVGFASLSAPTIGEAITTFVQWERVQSATFNGNISKQHDWYQVTLIDTTSDPVFVQFLFEAFAKAMETLLTQLGGNSKALILQVKDVESNRRSQLQSELLAQLVFDADENRLLVPEAIWHQSSPLADPDLHALNIDKCRQLLAEQDSPAGIDETVRALLVKHFDGIIVFGKPAELPPTQAEVCQLLHMTERTLIRKLKKQDTNFRTILTEERQRYSLVLLGERFCPVAEIAEKLGYTQTTNFCRAFKSWFGQSPNDYRMNDN